MTNPTARSEENNNRTMDEIVQNFRQLIITSRDEMAAQVKADSDAVAAAQEQYTEETYTEGN